MLLLTHSHTHTHVRLSPWRWRQSVVDVCVWILITAPRASRLVIEVSRRGPQFDDDRRRFRSPPYHCGLTAVSSHANSGREQETSGRCQARSSRGPAPRSPFHTTKKPLLRQSRRAVVVVDDANDDNDEQLPRAAAAAAGQEFPQCSLLVVLSTMQKHQSAVVSQTKARPDATPRSSIRCFKPFFLFLPPFLFLNSTGRGTIWKSDS